MLTMLKRVTRGFKAQGLKTQGLKASGHRVLGLGWRMLSTESSPSNPPNSSNPSTESSSSSPPSPPRQTKPRSNPQTKPQTKKISKNKCPIGTFDCSGAFIQRMNAAWEYTSTLRARIAPRWAAFKDSHWGELYQVWKIAFSVIVAFLTAAALSIYLTAWMADRHIVLGVLTGVAFFALWVAIWVM